MTLLDQIHRLIREDREWQAHQGVRGVSYDPDFLASQLHALFWSRIRLACFLTFIVLAVLYLIGFVSSSFGWICQCCWNTYLPLPTS